MSNDSVFLPHEASGSTESAAVATRKTWATPKVIEGTLMQDTNHTPAGTPDHTTAS